MAETTMETPAFAPRVMLGVIPYVSMPGKAGEAADFYARAFAAREIGRFADAASGGIMHVQLEINGGALMMTGMCAEGQAPRRPQGFHLQLVVADGQAWWDRAVAAGCEVVMPFERMFWGDRWGMLRDPFGLDWAVNEPGARPS
ncbi:VOC family protein [Amaricoccus solimangrovi]|uniref:Glyoxalase/bleomycin resistance/extradiol dioxygenase family protein n=1 Tax=Amaricoccus solimangrovi TaxID=2589815 RepID=A0A501WRM2_9RHOB|nr:glyoxalase/bleomycin resistance/extradiol dioxygenase family protein [Amaricoccus solimangrovi]TPE51020.1 glyoxalase/bleomycin resistance/extradiol dioxygenase family protein [Amaricoccus solimangrovi]